MTSYNQITQALEQIEQQFFTLIQSSSLPALSNGEIQFFSVEDAPGSSDPTTDKFVIATVGANYSQSHAGTKPLRLIPHIYKKTNGKTWAKDPSWPQTRRALGLALNEYRHNQQAWEANGYAALALTKDPRSGLAGEFRAIGQPLPPGGISPFWLNGARDYILICTNISPFLSLKNWTTHSPSHHSQALALWNPNDHICELYKRFGSLIDLWVVHGKTCVWDTFDTAGCIRNWLKTPNLSAPNTSRMPTFWRTPATTPRAPTWPNCTITREDSRDIIE